MYFRKVPAFQPVFIQISTVLTAEHDTLVDKWNIYRQKGLKIYEICMCLIIFEIYKAYFKPLI